MRNLLIRSYRTKSSLIEIFDDHGAKIVKKTALPLGENELLAQIRMFSSLPQELAIHFPRLISWQSSTRPYWYSMPYYDLPSLRQLAFFSDATANQVSNKLIQVMAFLIGNLYPFKKAGCDQSYLDRVYLNRFTNRLESMKQCHEHWVKVLSAKKIIYNNSVLLQPMESLPLIMKDKISVCLRPLLLYSIHGQMEFDHVLTTSDSSKQNKFILLDPRGLDDLADNTYDLGKVWQSLGSKVDLLKEGLFDLSYTVDAHDLVINNFQIYDKTAKKTSTIFEKTKKGIEAIMSDINDPYLLMRSEFAQAIHLCSAVPYYYKDPRPMETSIAFYLQGAIALNEFICNYM